MHIYDLPNGVLRYIYIYTDFKMPLLSERRGNPPVLVGFLIGILLGGIPKPGVAASGA